MILRICLLLMAICFGGCSCGRSEGFKFRLGVDESWQPLDFGSQEAYVNGFVEELLLEISKMGKVRFEKISANADTLFSDLGKGKYDAVLTSLPPYAYNEAKYDFSQNFLELGPVLIVEANSSYKKIAQLKGETIGILADDPSWLILQKHPDIYVRSYFRIPDLLNAAAVGEVAAILFNRIPAVNYVSDLYEGKLKIVSTPMTDKGLRLIAVKGREKDLVETFDKSLKQLKKTKRLKELLKKWSL